jgi:hypothetical protein
LSALGTAWQIHGTYGELKSMFVEEASRGQGIADAMCARSVGTQP